MAKTKLIVAAEKALLDLAAQMDVIDQIFGRFGDFEDSDLKKMTDRYAAAEAAVKALGTHLDNLDRAAGNEAKVADKLKKLPNIFKNKQELNDKRKAARVKYVELKARLGTIDKSIQDTIGVVKYAREHYPKD
jgi:hypothetical protein